MKLAVIVIAVFQVVVGITVIGSALDEPRDCVVDNLGDAGAEDWSPTVPFSNTISATLRSTRYDWQEFSFGFESKDKKAIGYLKFRRDGNITLTLQNWDPSNIGDQEEIQQLPGEFYQQLLLENWTVITLNRSSEILIVAVNGVVETEFPRVNIAPFRFLYAYVPTDQYIEVGFDCKRGVPELDEVLPPVTVATPKENKSPPDSTESGTTTTVAVVITVLLLVTVAAGGGFWYWKKKKRTDRQAGYLTQGYQGPKNRKKAEEGNMSSGESEGNLFSGKIRKVKSDKNMSDAEDMSMETSLGIDTLYNKEQRENEPLISENERRHETDATEDGVQSAVGYINNEMQQNNELPIINSGDTNDKQEKGKRETNTPTPLGKIKLSVLESRIIPNETMTNVIQRPSKDTYKSNDTPASLSDTQMSELERQIIPEEKPTTVTQMPEDTNIDNSIELAGEAFDELFLNLDEEPEILEELCMHVITPKTGEGEGAQPARLQEIEEITRNTGVKEPEVLEEPCIQVITPKLGQGEGVQSEKLEIPQTELTRNTDAKYQEVLEEPCVQVITTKSGEDEGAQPARLQEIEEKTRNTDAKEPGVLEEPCVQVVTPKPGEGEGAQPARLQVIEEITWNTDVKEPEVLEEPCVQVITPKLGQGEGVQSEKLEIPQIELTRNTDAKYQEVLEEPCVQAITIKSGEDEGAQPARLQEIEEKTRSTDAKVPGVLEEPCVQVVTPKPGEVEGAHPARLQEIQGEITQSTDAAPDIQVNEPTDLHQGGIMDQNSGILEHNTSVQAFRKQFGEPQYGECKKETHKLKQRPSSSWRDARKTESDYKYNWKRESE